MHRYKRSKQNILNKQTGQTIVEYLIVLSVFMGIYLASGQIIDWLATFNGQLSFVLRGVF